MLIIHPYTPGSKSAALLASSMLGPVFINGDDLTIKSTSPHYVVLNWGDGRLGDKIKINEDHILLNHPSDVATAIDKVKTLQILAAHGVKVPEYTTDIKVAKEWRAAGFTVVARKSITGKDGEGVHVIKPGQLFPNGCKLFTKFIGGDTEEYRVTVFNDADDSIRTLAVQKRVRVTKMENGSAPPPIEPEPIRVTSKGYGFELVINDLIPKGLRPAARAALEASNLTVAGIDIIYNPATKDFVVLEVNTAPALTPYVAERLAEALNDWVF